MTNRIFFVLITLATIGWILTAASQPLRADVTGTILGNVTDPTGAAVPGAHITLQNSLTGLIRHTVSDSTGGYEFLTVPIGTGYSATAEAQGFEKLTQSDITLLVNQRYRADFQLRVGAVTQSVSVSAQGAQVESSNTQLGTVIESPTILTMPLNGRSYTDMLSLQVGVVPESSGSAAIERSPGGDLDSGILSVNGGRENGNSFLINGGDVNESRDNGAEIVPSLDSIQEFRILTNNYDAEYGKFAGGIINVVTKSGTNQLHGDAFDFVRNNVFDSRSFFELNQINAATGQEIPGSALGSFKQNQFGGTLGRPILKDRLFTFTSYQGTRLVEGIPSGDIIVPSPAERAGDFSDVLSRGLPALTGTVEGSNALGDFAQSLSSELGYPVSGGEPYWFSGCANTAQCVFPGQVIPQAAWSPASAKTLQFIPSPVGYANGIPFWSADGDETLRDDNWSERIDLNSRRSGMWSFYYNFDDSSLLYPFVGGDVLGFPGATQSRAQQANMQQTHSFGSSTVNTLTLNFARFSYANAASGLGFGNVSQWGFVSGGLGIIPSNPTYAGLPEMALTGAYSASFGVDPGMSWQSDNTFEIADNLAKVVGRHTVKFGTQLEYFQINTLESIQENGLFDFSGSETNNDFADYVLGAPSTYLQSGPLMAHVRTRYGSIFGQDSYRVRPGFTVNYGVRWEVSEPYYDTQNLMMAFVPGEQSILFPTSPEGWVFPGDPGIPKTVSPTRWHNFSPRLGLAYSPAFSGGLLGKIFGGPGKFSIRAGGGIFNTSFEEIAANYELGDAPFGIFYTSPTLVYLSEPFKSRVSTTNPGQHFPSPIHVPGAPGSADINFATYQPISTSQVWGTNNVLPRMGQYNFTLQRQIGNSSILTVGYVGSVGRHLIGQVDFNPGNPQKCLQILAVFTAAGEASEGCNQYGEDTIYSINGQTFYGTRPYSKTSGRYVSQGILDLADNPAMLTNTNSSYNALQVSLQKRAGPLRFLAAYTYSKSMDDESGFIGPYINPYNESLSRGLSAFNMEHNFVISYDYSLPFGRWTRGRVTKNLLDGWAIAGVTHFSTGLPVYIHQSGDLSLCGCDPNDPSDVDEPNYLGGPIKFSNPRTSASQQFFSTNQFTSETLGHGGDANHSFFGGPGLNNWDFALHRNISITERAHLEFRAEFFNLFNHAQFSEPTGNFNSAAFGDVTNASAGRIGQMALKLVF
jgi:hypothetical protein